MWALTEMVRASRTSRRIGRFDVSDRAALCPAPGARSRPGSDLMAVCCRWMAATT